MSALDDLINTVEEVKGSLDNNSLLRSIIEKEEGLIVSLNTQKQLYDKGINALGVSIDSYAPYSPWTVKLKMKKSQPYNRVTLRDSGQFHASFEIRFTDDGFTIGSRDSLTEELVRKYSESIFGLTQKNKDYLKKSIILQNLITELRNLML